MNNKLGVDWVTKHPKDFSITGDAPFCVHLPDDVFIVTLNSWDMLVHHSKRFRSGQIPYIGGSVSNVELMNDQRGLFRFSCFRVRLAAEQGISALDPMSPYGQELLQEIWHHHGFDEREQLRKACPGDANSAVRMLRTTLVDGSPEQRQWLSTRWRDQLLGTVWRRTVNQIASTARGLADERHLGSVEFRFPLNLNIRDSNGLQSLVGSFGYGATLAQPDLSVAQVAAVQNSLASESPIPVHLELFGSARHRLDADESRLSFLDAFAACEIFLRETIDAALDRKYSEDEIAAFKSKRHLRALSNKALRGRVSRATIKLEQLATVCRKSSAKTQQGYSQCPERRLCRSRGGLVAVGRVC